jgi:hypothetical protein
MGAILLNCFPIPKKLLNVLLNNKLKESLIILAKKTKAT